MLVGNYIIRKMGKEIVIGDLRGRDGKYVYNDIKEAMIDFRKKARSEGL